MVDFTKYDALIQDLSLIESETAILTDKLRDTTEREEDLQMQIIRLRQENSNLQKRITDLELEIESIKQETEGSVFNTLNSKERESLKIKLQDIISKIDYHLSS